MRNRISVTVRSVITSLFVLACAMPVWALPEADAAPESGSWKGIAAGILFLIAIVFANFMSPKRGHQD